MFKEIEKYRRIEEVFQVQEYDKTKNINNMYFFDLIQEPDPVNHNMKYSIRWSKTDFIKRQEKNYTIALDYEDEYKKIKQLLVNMQYEDLFERLIKFECIDVQSRFLSSIE